MFERFSRRPRLTGGAGEGSPAPSPDIPLLEVSAVSKSFGAVRALRSVSLQVQAGEVHALLGANGAGKSTLIRMLSGDIQPDDGRIALHGAPVAIQNPLRAQELGIAVLHQELNLVPGFSPLENMALGLAERGRFGLARRSVVRKRALVVAHELEAEFDLDRPVRELTVAERWLVAIARALMRSAILICLDEPTESLSDRETAVLRRIVRRLASDGAAVLYVSHRLDEVEELCDRATVFRDGRVVDDLARAELRRDRLVASITGGRTEALSVAVAESEPSGGAGNLLQVRNLTRGASVQNISFDLRRGEVLGIAGLVGSGRTELARLLAAADRCDSGVVSLDGQPLKLSQPSTATESGIALIPEERRSQGLIMEKSGIFNITLGSTHKQRRRSHTPFLHLTRSRALAAEAAASVNLDASRLGAPVSQLSGGNQQKILLARVLLKNAKVMILDEPTRGIDVGTRAQIHTLIRDFADKGHGVIVIASDFEELLGCDRVLVMARGAIVTEFHAGAISRERLLEAAYGQH
jgi:ribose transport system ATP-binding protein